MTARDPQRTLDQPHPSRFAPTDAGFEAAISAHHEAVARGDAGYTDPVNGNFVFTAAYLAERECCDCGCRHCPYVSS